MKDEENDIFQNDVIQYINRDFIFECKSVNFVKKNIVDVY